MGNFVTSNPALPTLKQDLFAPTGIPQECAAADINNLWSAAGDLRDALPGWVNVKSSAFGAKGDGTDDTVAIQAAINSLSAGVVVVPSGMTCVVSGLTMKSGVWLYLGGATLKMKVNAAIGVRMLDFSGVTKSGLLGVFTLDGNRANQTNTGSNGQIGVYVGPGASDIYIESGYATGFSEDSLYIGSAGTAPRGIIIGSWVADQATRNGVSITNAQDVEIGYLEARSTNGAAPQAGLDIETNSSADTLANIHINRLNVHGNNGFGAQLLGQMNGTAFVHGGVTIDRLDAYGNLSGGVLAYKLRHLSILAGEIGPNTGSGIVISRDMQLLRVNAHIHDNTQRGINAALTSQTVASSDWDFSGSVVRNNSQASANTQDGVRLDSDDAAKVLTRVRGDGVRLYDDQVSMTQRFGITTGTNTSAIEFNGYIPANATGNYSFGGTSYPELQRIYKSVTLDFPSIAAGSNQILNATVVGAAVNDQVYLSPSGLLDGLVFSGYVSATDTVRITVGNLTAGALDPGPIAWKITVIKH